MLPDHVPVGWFSAMLPSHLLGLEDHAAGTIASFAFFGKPNLKIKTTSLEHGIM
jgi:hypothetical protein